MTLTHRHLTLVLYIIIITFFTRLIKRRGVYYFELAEGAVLIRGQCLFWAVFINTLARMRREGYSSCLVCVCVCVCLSVGMYVCMSVRTRYSGSTRNRSITKDAIVRFAAIIKRRFS